MPRDLLRRRLLIDHLQRWHDKIPDCRELRIKKKEEGEQSNSELNERYQQIYANALQKKKKSRKRQKFYEECHKPCVLIEKFLKIHSIVDNDNFTSS